MRWTDCSGALLALTLFLGSCSTAPSANARTAKAQAELDAALAGRVAGTPRRCISNFPHTDVRVIDDWTILYDDGPTVYVQTPQGGCNGLSNRNRTLVTRHVGTNQMCQGDITETVDLRTGISGGACVFGPFVPYTRPRS